MVIPFPGLRNTDFIPKAELSLDMLTLRFTMKYPRGDTCWTVEDNDLGSGEICKI